MNTRHPRLLVPLLIGTVLLGAPVAASADKKEAQRHYQAGMKSYNLRRFAEAIAAFERAYDEDPAPSLLFNIAQSHRKLDQHEQAIFFYRRFLDSKPPAEKRREAEQRIAEAQATLDKQTAARVQTEPGPAAVAAAETPAPPMTPPPRAGEGEPVPTVTAAAPPVGAEAPSRRLRTAAFVAGGLGAATLVAGAFFGQQARALGDENAARPIYDRDEDARGRRAERLGWASLGLGAAALGAGVVLYVLDARAGRGGVAVAPVLGPRLAGVGAAVGF